MMVSFSFVLFKRVVMLNLLEEFAFYVNKRGQRSRKEFMVHWEGMPTGFGKLFTYQGAYV